MRRLVGLLALAAMALSLSEGIVAGVCASVADGPAEASSHANHGAADAPADTPDRPSCPMPGALAMTCSAGALALTTPLVVPEPPDAIELVLTRSFILPPSTDAADLFHPPRA